MLWITHAFRKHAWLDLDEEGGNQPLKLDSTPLFGTPKLGISSQMEIIHIPHELWELHEMPPPSLLFFLASFSCGPTNWLRAPFFLTRRRLLEKVSRSTWLELRPNKNPIERAQLSGKITQPCYVFFEVCLKHIGTFCPAITKPGNESYNRCLACIVS